MRFEYLIGMRYLRARRRERFVSLIAIISLAGVTLGTFALTVALSVMSGFQVDLRARLLAFTPQIVVERSDGQVWNPAALRSQIASMPGVSRLRLYVTSQVMAVGTTPTGAPSYMSGGMLRGVIAKDNPVLTELQSTLQTGSLASLAEMHPVEIIDNGAKRQVELPGAILGRTLSLDLGALRIGDTITLISPASLAGAAGSPRLQAFRGHRIFLFRNVRFRFHPDLHRHQGRAGAARRRSAARIGPGGAADGMFRGACDRGEDCARSPGPASP